MDRRTGQTPQVSKAGLESTACTQPSTWGPLHYRGHESLADKETENGPLADLTLLRSDGHDGGDRNESPLADLTHLRSEGP